MTQLRGLPVILPPIEAQATFVKRFEEMQFIKSQQETAAQKAMAAFGALLAKTFNESYEGNHGKE